MTSREARVFYVWEELMTPDEFTGERCPMIVKEYNMKYVSRRHQDAKAAGFSVNSPVYKVDLNKLTVEEINAD